MSWNRPSPQVVWKAIEVFLRIAYDGPPPIAVQRRLDQLRACVDAIYDCPAFERIGTDDPTRFMLRLGNRFYPHMKMAIDRAADGGYLFAADTHDRHCMPQEQSREYGAFCQLMEKNKSVAKEIESAWEQEGLRTFKLFLHQDLQSRRQSQPH